ncbi:hypothetical protein CRUP_018170, partial [Coryphaenoides rupestris]
METSSNGVNGKTNPDYLVSEQVPEEVGAARHSVCSTASFWSTAPPSEGSWTGQSEQSFASNEGASPCDLNSVEACAEEPAHVLTHS